MSVWGTPVSLGGGGIPLLTRAAWNALTTAQKQSYGLLAIQDAASGYSRGELVNGADYQVVGRYIPYSDPEKVLCEAYRSNFNAGSPLSWGYGSAPIQMDSGLDPAADAQENAVYLGVAAKEKFAYVDLGSQKAPFTAYIVAKLVDPGGFTRILSSMASRSSGQGILFYGSTINVSSWGSDTSTSVSSSSAYFAAALRYNGAGSGAGIVGSAGTLITKTPSNSSRYLTIGRTDTDGSTAYAEPANLYLRYLSVVSEDESESVMKQNLAALETAFIS